MCKCSKTYKEIVKLAKEVGNEEIVKIATDELFDDLLDEEIHKYSQASMIAEEMRGK